MISAVQIANAQHRLELEFQLIRHFLIHPQGREARDAFIAQQAKVEAAKLERFFAQKHDRSEIEAIAASAHNISYRKWLNDNLHSVKEFSENRLRQMELILRYAVFESYLLKAIGNILWEYPALREHSLHKLMKLRYKSRKLAGSVEKRIDWTRAAVDAVDRLPFAKFHDDCERRPVAYLWEYLSKCLGLEFGQEVHCQSLEWARQARNHIVHRSFELTICDKEMTRAETCLANFPVLLVEVASKKYPEACTIDPFEEEEDGTPQFVGLELALRVLKT